MHDNKKFISVIKSEKSLVKIQYMHFKQTTKLAILQCLQHSIVYRIIIFKKFGIFIQHYEAKLCFLGNVRGFRNKDALCSCFVLSFSLIIPTQI